VRRETFSLSQSTFTQRQEMTPLKKDIGCVKLKKEEESSLHFSESNKLQFMLKQQNSDYLRDILPSPLGSQPNLTPLKSQEPRAFLPPNVASS